MKKLITLGFLFCGFLHAQPVVNIGNDIEVPVSTRGLVNNLMNIPVTASVTDASYPIASYSWSYTPESYLDDNFTASAAFTNTTGTWTNTVSANTNLRVRPYLGSYRIRLSVTNTNAQTTSSTIWVRVGEGLTGAKTAYYFYNIPNVHSYKYASPGETSDVNGYLLPKTESDISGHAANVWDNERDGTTAPIFNMFSRVKFSTSARYIVVRMSSEWSPVSKLGLKINNVVTTGGIVCTGVSDCRIDLGNEGVSKTVEIVNGYQGVGAGLPANGTYVRAIISSTAYPVTFIPPPSKAGRILWLGDSITSDQESLGGDEEFNSAVCLLRESPYNLQIMVEGGGGIAFTMYTDDSAKRAQLKSLIIGADPAKIWIQIGSNDWGLNKGYTSLSNYKGDFNSFWSEILTALPAVTLYLQTELPRTSPAFAVAYSPNNSYTPSWTLDAARQVKRDFVTAHPGRCVLVNGSVANGSTGLMHSSEWNSSYILDNVHPNKAAHAIMAPRIFDELQNVPKIPVPGQTANNKYVYQVFSSIGQLLKTFTSTIIIDNPSTLLSDYPGGIYIITLNGVSVKFLR